MDPAVGKPAVPARHLGGPLERGHLTEEPPALWMASRGSGNSSNSVGSPLRGKRVPITSKLEKFTVCPRGSYHASPTTMTTRSKDTLPRQYPLSCSCYSSQGTLTRLFRGSPSKPLLSSLGAVIFGSPPQRCDTRQSPEGISKPAAVLRRISFYSQEKANAAISREPPNRC